MTLHRSVAKSLLMAASIGIVMPLHAAAPRGPRLAQAEELPKRKPKREDATPVVPGVIVQRKDGRHLALAVESNRFVLRFLDEDKRLTTTDATRAFVRWKAVGLTGEERSVLNAGDDGQSLRGNTVVQRPLRFKAFVTLLDGSGEVIESLTVDLRE
jgi:hypothetical protein